MLNTGIGVPRHPLFFLGKRFSGVGSGAAGGRKRGKSADEAVEVGGQGSRVGWKSVGWELGGKGES